MLEEKLLKSSDSNSIRANVNGDLLGIKGDDIVVLLPTPSVSLISEEFVTLGSGTSAPEDSTSSNKKRKKIW